MKNILLAFLFITFSFQASADNLSDSNKLFDWAEINYPHYFGPSGMQTFQLDYLQDHYLVRYYPGTFTYIGTVGENIFVYGDVFNGLLAVGKISDYIQTVQTNDISGVWDLTGQDDARACGEGISTFSRVATVTVNGNQMTMVTNTGITVQGTINGNTISTSSQYAEDGGIVSETGIFTFSENSFSGSSNWTWSAGSSSCSGSTTISGTKR